MSSRLEPARLEAGCAGCRHFNDRPLELEAALPGLSSLSSAYAAVRSQDGICALHDRYVAATSRCALHAERTEHDLKARPPAPDNRRKSAPCPSP
jgi:hypothetical protein